MFKPVVLQVASGCIAVISGAIHSASHGYLGQAFVTAAAVLPQEVAKNAVETSANAVIELLKNGGNSV